MFAPSVLAGSAARCASLCAALCLAVPVAAQDTSVARYTITVSGLTAGRMTLAANHDGAGYALTSNAASAGLAGLFRSFSLTTRAQGRDRGGELVPERYSSQSEGARAGRGAELTFQDGLATVVSAAASRPDAPLVDPAEHRGAVDPLTGFYAVLRDVVPETACRLDLRMFDGHRISRVTLSQPVPGEGGLTCQGVYRRIDGYPPQDLAERATFPFVLRYTAGADGRLRVAEVSMDSLFGPARMIRDE
ncbi:MAG: DUF3108 domain-containing protein [Pseudotabrizicola sp.]|uniref:DUF3108 domain-containing protein n=1 Tax=Pseudotabrizicola sp. TaxID=2939647 RepID=UPI002722620F|nr:DUF3108 domain-containing protein [Pseudotabrizicola sp.]MDO9639939.1 DUF3108 domain-containing protein [Pseudotabrizicola sp.]